MIPQENGDVGPPPGMDRLPSAARVGSVDDVVVDEAGRVDDLDHGRPEGGVRAGPVAGHPGAEGEEGGAEPLPPGREEVGVDLVDEGIVGADHLGQPALDAVEVRPDLGVEPGEREGGVVRFGHRNRGLS